MDFEETKALMRALVVAIKGCIYGEEVRACKLSWTEHIGNGHVPFRRDCKQCQIASARDRPHRRVNHPQPYVLSLDLAGPMKKGFIDGKACRYLMVAYTWPKPKPSDLLRKQEAVKEAGQEKGPEEDAGPERPVADPRNIGPKVQMEVW